MDGQRRAFLRVPLYKGTAADKSAERPPEPCLNKDGEHSAISFTLQFLE